MTRFWEIKQQASEPETLDLYIYSAVQGDGYDWWTGEKIESETSAEYFRQELDKHKNAKQINVYINSLGGSVMEGVGIYNQLRRHPANVTAYIDGFACSIASSNNATTIFPILVYPISFAASRIKSSSERLICCSRT